MGVEDNYYQITDLDANTTFYDWVAKENDDIIEKLNLMKIYGASAGDGNIVVTIGTTGNSYDAGDAVISLNDTISGVTISGNLVVTGTIGMNDGTVASSLVTSVNGLTGAVTIAGITGAAGATGSTGASPDPIFISKNQLTNGNFDIWQRGTSFTGKTNKYFADRWARFATTSTLAKITTGTISRQSFSAGQTDVLGDPDYYIKSSLIYSGITTTDFVGIENRIEGAEKFIGEKVYVDGYVRMEGTTGATVDIYIRRNTDGSTYTTEEFADRVYVPGTTWTSFLVGHTVSYTGSTFTENGYTAIGIKLNDIPSGETFEAANIRTFATQGVTLQDSPFREKSDIQEELLKCSRFYQRSYALDKLDGSTTMLNSTDPDFTSARFSVTNNNEFYYDFPVEMRTAPTVSIYSPSTGVTTDGYNKTAALDMRLTSGTSGWNGNIRLHTTGQATLNTTTNTRGIIFDIVSGAVIFDDIFVHYVANSDYTV